MAFASVDPLPSEEGTTWPRIRGGLVFKAHRLVDHSTLGLRVIETKKKEQLKTFSGRPTESQHQNLVLDIIDVLSSLDSGCFTMTAMIQACRHFH